MKHKLKNILAIIVCMIILASCGSSTTGDSEKKELNVYNWGDYIDPQVIDMFEEETGIKVNYEVYATNEDMYTKVKSGASSYDIIIPSDYMIQKMISEDMLQPINFDNIPNYSNIDDKFKNLDYDPTGEYSVPYMWGTVGILYNTTMVDEPVDSYDILWDEKYAGQIYMYNSQRETIGISLLRLGYSMNSTNPDEIAQATEELIKQKPLVQAYLGDPVKDKMIGNEGAMAVVYSGDALYCMQQNPDLAYVVPSSGSNMWIDSIVIPKNAENVEEAEMFIDFLCRPDIALMNTEYIGYSTTNKAAYEMLPQEVQENEIYWPSDETFNNLEVFQDLGEANSYYTDAWLTLMSS